MLPRNPLSTSHHAHHPIAQAAAWTLALLLAVFTVLSWLSLEGCGKGSCTSGGKCNCAAGGTGVASCNAEGQLVECRCTAVNLEGGACAPGTSKKGSCVDPENVCMEWSAPMASALVASCIRPCTGDADCATSMAGHVCASVAPDQKACVSAALGEGQRVDVSLAHKRPVTGCQAPLLAIHRLAGSLLLDLDDDQASCGRRCGTDGDCTAQAPDCNIGVFTSTGAAAQGGRGVCTVRKALKGARCSLRAITESCDLSQSQNMVCTDLGIENGDNAGDQDKYGVCIEICDMVDPTCRAAPDSAHAPKCEFGFFNDQTLGVCDDKCNAFPDDCTGMGSPPAAGDMARGARCIPFKGKGTIDKPEQALCVDVEQHGATYPAYDFHTRPAASCDQNEIACPDKSVCVEMDAATHFSVCVFGCAPGAAMSGCESTGYPACKPDFGTGTQAGICEPSSSG